MRVLITGGCGFIGSHIIEALQGKASIRVLDSLRTGYRHNIAPFNTEFIEGDIRNRELVRKAVKDIDYIFHLAAMVSVPESMTEITECVEINNTGTVILLEEAAAAGVKKLCFSTSAAIYGDNPTVPKREEMCPEPRSPYAISKLDGEYYCDMFTTAGKLKTACLRYFNVFGPRQDPKGAYAAAVPIFIARALANQPIEIYGDGEQTRDFIYVKDIVAANLYMAEHAHTGVFNIANGGRLTINELAEKIIRLTGSKSEIRHREERPGDVKHSSASVDRAVAAGFRTTYDFDEGLKATIDFFRK